MFSITWAISLPQRLDLWFRLIQPCYEITKYVELFVYDLKWLRCVFLLPFTLIFLAPCFENAIGCCILGLDSDLCILCAHIFLVFALLWGTRFYHFLFDVMDEFLFDFVAVVFVIWRNCFMFIIINLISFHACIIMIIYFVWVIIWLR